MLFCSVTKKLRLAPKSKPYQFRIFIPHGLESLRVNPTCGLFQIVIQEIV